MRILRIGTGKKGKGRAWSVGQSARAHGLTVEMVEEVKLTVGPAGPATSGRSPAWEAVKAVLLISTLALVCAILGVAVPTQSKVNKLYTAFSNAVRVSVCAGGRGCTPL